MVKIVNTARNLANSIMKKFITTRIKYLLSYLILYVMLIVGFFLIMKEYFAEVYLNQLLQQTEKQLEIWSEGIESNLNYLMQLHGAVEKNLEVQMSRYDIESKHNYQTMVELRKYDWASELVNSVIYKTPNGVLSTNLPVTYEEESVFHIYDNAEICFDIKPYLDNRRSQLIFAGTEAAGELIYLPVTDSSQDYLLMYVLDKTEMKRSLECIELSQGAKAFLLDSEKNIIMETGEEEQVLNLTAIEIEKGSFSLENSKYVCTKIGQGDLYVVVVITENLLMEEVSAIFVNAYFVFYICFLGIAGVLLISFLMRFTYGSLESFAQKFLEKPDSRDDYLKQLDKIFTNKAEEFTKVEEKLEKYRTNVQKSLLDSIIVDSDTFDIDVLFEADEVLIFLLVVQMKSENDSFDWIQNLLKEMLPPECESFMLKIVGQEIFYLLNYKSDVLEEKEKIERVLEKFNEEQGYAFFLSSGSNSPLDIPEMYREIKAERINNEENNKAADLIDLSYRYPYEKLDELSNSLYEYDFERVRYWFEEILQEINGMNMESKELENFFIRSVLIDAITTLGNAMNRAHIKFDSFSETYYETLYLSRSCFYHEKQNLIKANIEKLLKVYEVSASDIAIGKIDKMIKESFENPDFSITDLADAFHVSAPYMSYLFKKEKNIGFAEYVWNLRLEKTKKLLLDTDMSVENISNAVGYLNVSSFRRKFKQDMGITPLQYRHEMKKQTEL